jgi:NitT/TauT family transport system permease protein
VTLSPLSLQNEEPLNGLAPAEASSTPDPTTRRRRPAVLRRVLPPLLLMVLAAGTWEFVTYVVLDPTRRFLLPPLQTVISQSFGVAVNLTTLASALGVTAELALVGLVIAMLLGVSIAVLMTWCYCRPCPSWPWCR